VEVGLLRDGAGVRVRVVRLCFVAGIRNHIAKEGLSLSCKGFIGTSLGEL
jgi:hypothetical protein